MPETKTSGCAFDPNQCPLLQGLPPDEQAFQMQTNPVIRACAQGMQAGGKMPLRCRTQERNTTRARPGAGRERNVPSVN